MATKERIIPPFYLWLVVSGVGIGLTAGCISLGYISFRPQEVAIYDEFLEPVKEPLWTWVRGKVSGDLDGDGQSEEAVLATVHDGSRSSPGPFRSVTLLICRREKKEKIELKFRREIYREGAKTSDRLPAEVLLDPTPSPMHHCSASIVEGENKKAGLLVISLWGEAEKGRCWTWHGAFRLTPENLENVFSTYAIQTEPTLEILDLDRDGTPEIVVPSSVFPPLASSPTAPPFSNELSPLLWKSVFVLGPERRYLQDNRKHPKLYDDLTLAWQEHYAYQILLRQPPEILAEYEYYLGLLHSYRKRPGLSRLYLEKVISGTPSARLRKCAEDALKTIANE